MCKFCMCPLLWILLLLDPVGIIFFYYRVLNKRKLFKFVLLIAFPSLLFILWILFCCCCPVAQSFPTLCSPMNCDMPGFPVFHHLPELAQTHVHGISDAIQPSLPLSSPSPPAFSLSQRQGLFQWVGSSHQVVSIGDSASTSEMWPANIVSYVVDRLSTLLILSFTAQKFLILMHQIYLPFSLLVARAFDVIYLVPFGEGNGNPLQ